MNPENCAYILSEQPEGMRLEEQFATAGQGEAAAEGPCDSTSQCGRDASVFHRPREYFGR